jgi:glutamyl-tRNA synthetase
VLRVEDLDPQRSKPEHEQRALDDLRWLGLDWDEGPDVGGAHGPYRQSQRGDHYAAALARLDTYACTCTRKELRETASAPHGLEPVYPGTCRDRTRHPDRPASLRWRVPVGEVCFDDRIAGRQCQDVAAQVGDFVLRRGDGAWAYQLAVVVDDAAMQVTEVLRGADLLDSTARQILLARALGLTVPSHAHAPLIIGPDRDKLSKRHGAPDLSDLRERGVDPRLVVAVLARSAGLLGGEIGPEMEPEMGPEMGGETKGVNRVRAAELIPGFDLASVGREGAVLDRID